MASKKDDKQVMPEVAVSECQKFPTALLAKSELMKRFGLHRDVVSAILTKDEYTLEDAENEIKKYINQFK